MTTTFRADTRDGAYAHLVAFSAANPTFTLAVYPNQPSAFGDRPLAYVQLGAETINHTGTTLYQRLMTGFAFVFVWASSADQKELAPIRDDVIDAFITYGMAHVHLVSNQTVSTPTAVEDVELVVDGGNYPATIVTHGDTLALQGSL